MTDGVTLQASTLATPPAGTEVATDDCGSDGHAQIVKLGTSTDGSASLLPASTTAGLMVNPRPSVTRIQVSQTTTATAYEAKDAVGGLITFSNAAKTSGGSIRIEGATIVDEDSQSAALDLVLFRASISAPTDEATFDPTDAELLDCVGFIRFASSDYSVFNDNSVAHRDCGLTATLSGTSLYGVLMTTGTPTYASTSSIHVTLTIVQD